MDSRTGRTERSSGRVHDVFQTGFLDEALDICDLSGNGGGRCANLCKSGVSLSCCACTWSCEEVVGKPPRED